MKMRSLVVIHYFQGKVVRGITNDFIPGKKTFHIDNQANGLAEEIEVEKLKAVFFVKTFDGDPYRVDRQDVERKGLGKRVRVRFHDGESILGYTLSYAADKNAFLVYPADPDSNNERIYVVKSATCEVSFTDVSAPAPNP